jgi:two-component system LytT family response regulator
MIAGSPTRIDRHSKRGTRDSTLVAVIGDASAGARHLRLLLARDRGVHVVAECQDGPSTLDAIHRYRPDVVFVSTRLPLLTGFDVARSIAPSAVPAFVFLTNDAGQALAAFSLNALDCVSVPVTPERVAVTLRRARRRLAPRRLSAMLLADTAESLREVRRLIHAYQSIGGS